MGRTRRETMPEQQPISTHIMALLILLLILPAWLLEALKDGGDID